MNASIKFDSKIKTLIGGLLELQDECYHQENFFLGESFFNINKNKLGFIYYHSFYSLFRDICSTPLYFLINEEVSNAHGRDYFPVLLNEIINEGHYTVKKKHHSYNQNIDLQHTYEELSHLLINNYNELFGSQMLDFQISSYSAFENWITKLYNSLCPDHKTEIIEKRKAAIKNLLKTYNSNPSDIELDKTVTNLFEIKGDFISFPDRVNEIYKKIDHSLYKRTINKDKDIILFIGKIRNTVHNSGIHNGKNSSINVNGHTHNLEKGKPYKSPSWIETLKLTKELILIYTELLKSIPDRINIADSFISGEIDYSTFHTLKTTCNDFIGVDENPNDAVEIHNAFYNFLKNKIQLSEVAVNNIIQALKSKKSLFAEDSEFLEFLAQAFTKV